MPETDEIAKSEFNSAIVYLNRVTNLLVECDNSRINLSLFSWFLKLSALSSAISIKMKPDEKEKRTAILKDLITDLKSLNEYNADAEKKIKVDFEIFFKLDALEVWLTDIADKNGLLLKAAQDLGKIILTGGG